MGEEAGLLPTGNDETDGLLRDEDARGKGVVRVPVPQEEGSGSRGSLMKCRHYRYRTKPTSAWTSGEFITREHTLPHTGAARPNCRSTARATSLTSLTAIRASASRQRREHCYRLESLSTLSSLFSFFRLRFVLSFEVVSRKCLVILVQRERERKNDGFMLVHESI